MKRILMASIAAFALPALAMAQSNDSMSNSNSTPRSTSWQFPWRARAC